MSSPVADGLGPVPGPVGVGGPDDPALSPRNDEQDALLGPQDDAGVGADRLVRHDHVHALRHPHLVAGLDAAELVHQVGPHPGAHHDPLGGDVDVAPGLLVVHPRAGDPLPVRAAQQLAGADPGGDQGPVRGGGPGHGQRVPGVVRLRVVVQQRPGQARRLQRGREPQRPAYGQVPVVRHRPLGPLERVVQHQAGADVRPFEHLAVQRVEERNRLDQVRGQLRDEQVALTERLPHQLEVKLLEVPKAAVDELARPARRARGKVPGLDQRDPEPPGRGVQRGSRAGHAAADDEDVEVRAGQAIEDSATVTGIQPAVFGHELFLLLKCPAAYARGFTFLTGPAYSVCTSSTSPARPRAKSLYG